MQTLILRNGKQVVLSEADFALIRDALDYYDNDFADSVKAKLDAL